MILCYKVRPIHCVTVCVAVHSALVHENKKEAVGIQVPLSQRMVEGVNWCSAVHSERCSSLPLQNVALESYADERFDFSKEAGFSEGTIASALPVVTRILMVSVATPSF